MSPIAMVLLFFSHSQLVLMSLMSSMIFSPIDSPIGFMVSNDGGRDSERNSLAGHRRWCSYRL